MRTEVKGYSHCTAALEQEWIMSFAQGYFRYEYLLPTGATAGQISDHAVSQTASHRSSLEGKDQIGPKQQNDLEFCIHQVKVLLL